MVGMVLVVNSSARDTVGMMLPVINIPAFVMRAALMDGMVLFVTEVIFFSNDIHFVAVHLK